MGPELPGIDSYSRPGPVSRRRPPIRPRADVRLCRRMPPIAYIRATVSIQPRYSMSHVKDIDSLYNFIGYVVLRAPDRFPTEDYLPADQQMTLERAFAELRQGAMLVKADAPDLPGVDKLEAVLDEALALYRRGDDVQGAHRLQDFEAMIFKT